MGVVVDVLEVREGKKEENERREGKREKEMQRTEGGGRKRMSRVRKKKKQRGNPRRMEARKERREGRHKHKPDRKHLLYNERIYPPHHLIAQNAVTDTKANPPGARRSSYLISPPAFFDSGLGQLPLKMIVK